MPKIEYIPWKPKKKSIAMVIHCQNILREYTHAGYTLTLRQLYYQLVARDIIPNSIKSYKNLGSLVQKARDAGIIDWDSIVDRTRSIRELSHWEGRNEFLNSVIPQYKHDLWLGQDTRVVVFVEKEALSEVVGRESNHWDVPFFPNKGYLSASSIWRFARSLVNHDDCRKFVVLHLGDHDPSGLDMTRDIDDRLQLYTQQKYSNDQNVCVSVERIALNMDQINEYDPPPNPAKITDSRFETYQKDFGNESWELDALDPKIISELIRTNIKKHLQIKKFNARKRLQEKIKSDLMKMITSRKSK